MSVALQAVAVIALIVWGIGTFTTAILGLLKIMAPFEKDDRVEGLLMFFLPFLWPLALAGMILVTILEVRDDTKAESKARAAEKKRQEERELRAAEARIAERKAAEEHEWEENFYGALHDPYNA